MVREWFNIYSVTEPDVFARLPPLVRLGRFLNIGFVVQLWDDPMLRACSLALCLMGGAILALWIYRGTRGGILLSYRSPRLFRWLHHPALAPVFFLSSAWSILVVPWWLADTNGLHLNLKVAYSVSACSLLIFPVGLFLLWRRLSRSDAKEFGNHPAAAWAAWSEVRQAPTASNKKNATWLWTLPILVHRRGVRAAWTTGASPTVIAPSAEGCYRHILLEGGTGSGKGYYFFSHLIASSRNPFIYQDFKGETPGYDILWRRTGKRPITYGAAAPGGWPSLCFNPVQECREDANPQDAFQTLAAALIPDPEGGEASWVPETARPILAHLLTHGGYPTLGALVDHMAKDGVISVLEAADLPQGMRKALEGQNVKEYVGTTVMSRLAPFAYGWGRAVTSRHDFNLEDMLTRGGYVLSAETIRSRRAPLVLFWQLLLRKAMTENRHWGTSFFLDEALAAGRIPDADDALNTLRSRGISLIFGVQTESGLEKLYGRGAHSLIDAFTSRVWLLNGLNARDRKKITDDMGTYTTMRKSGSGDETPDSRNPLISPDDLKVRGRKEEDRWAIFDVMGATSSGHSIIARLIPGPPDLVRLPSAEELAAFKAKHGAMDREEAEAAGGETPPEIPPLPETDRPPYRPNDPDQEPPAYDADPELDY